MVDGYNETEIAKVVLASLDEVSPETLPALYAVAVKGAIAAADMLGNHTTAAILRHLATTLPPPTNEALSKAMALAKVKVTAAFAAPTGEPS